jgi:predicted site-specific integrase-resolvase
VNSSPFSPPLPSSAEVPELFKIEYLSKRWGISRAVLYSEVRKGNLRAIILSEKLVRIHPEDAAAYIAARRRAG